MVASARSPHTRVELNSMIYTSLGRTGVQVSRVCLGTMTFGWAPDDWGSTESDARPVFDTALELGINFFDSADVYARGVSEEILGKFMKGKRDSLVIATKCHGKMSDTDPNTWGNSRRHILEACDASLRRLGTDYIDLYQIHRPQPAIPIDETLRALDDLIRAGKVRYIGTSTFAGWQACEARYVAKMLGLNTFISEQPPYNLLDRSIETELLPFLRTYDLACLPWSPLAGGQLSGKYLGQDPSGARYSSSDPFGRAVERAGPRVKELNDLAQAAGISLTKLSLGWVTHQPGVTSLILGAKSPEQLKEAVEACLWDPGDELRAKIDEVAPPGSRVTDYYSANFGPNARPDC